MRRLLIIVATFAALLLLAASARASHRENMFGDFERFRVIQDVSLMGPNGERLVLAHKLTIRSFVLPFSVRNDGFALIVPGEGHIQYALPEGADLERKQAAGLLPNPLPSQRLPIIDLLFGYSLWLVLASMAGWPFIKPFFRK